MGQPPGRTVRVVGYPDGAGAPITCSNRSRLFSPSQVEFDCGGYADGTSGSPLLAEVDPSTGLGTVIGVIGGYEQGGYTPDVSYAARFGAQTAALYQVAISESIAVQAEVDDRSSGGLQIQRKGDRFTSGDKARGWVWWRRLLLAVLGCIVRDASVRARLPPVAPHDSGSVRDHAVTSSADTLWKWR